MSNSAATIRMVFLKDLRLLWPLALMVAACCLLWALLPGETSELRKLAGTLRTAASAFLLVAVIQLDAPASLRSDWLTRPISPVALLAEKFLFLSATVLLPTYLSDVAPRLLAGLSIGEASQMAATELFVSLAAAVPLMAVAALTANLVETAVLAMALAILAVILPPLSFAMAGHPPDPIVAGPKIWTLIRSLALLAMAGSGLALWLQYVPRRTGAARIAFAATALLATIIQFAFAFSLSAPS